LRKPWCAARTLGRMDVLPRRVLLLPNTMVETFAVVALPCPRRGTPRQLMLSTEGKVAEITRVRRPLGSWFIDQTVEGNGGTLHVASTIDPLYVVLPLLERNSDRFRPWTDIVGESDAAYGKVAAHLPGLSQSLAAICDCKSIPGLDDALVVRLNPDRVFRWLLCKVEAVLTAIKAGAAGRSATGTTAVARTLNLDASATTSNAGKADDPNGPLQTAVDVVCEYVSPIWSTRLYQHFKLNEAKRDAALFSALFAEQNRTTRAVDAQSSHESNAKSSKSAPQLSLAQKRLRKVDTKGMATLSNFFPTKKAKSGTSNEEQDDE